ncbi:unnamed protein product [Vitrella brassicaformis CCMP3155]|uniref:Phospholipid scramblase n=1 Tax=Vitrella brassicaformis (strain CCMP3155) TaxID=1169540 RepID=A0A0G4FQP5_VITBC|nr:unnamed protein product [Vitrella brassicaformis CCMP3155]|eukprot:CEM16779.1 unnamed protein product [Vitrella brassicaformis CCMP3155]
MALQRPEASEEAPGASAPPLSPSSPFRMDESHYAESFRNALQEKAEADWAAAGVGSSFARAAERLRGVRRLNIERNVDISDLKNLFIYKVRSHYAGSLLFSVKAQPECCSLDWQEYSSYFFLGEDATHSAFAKVTRPPTRGCCCLGGGGAEFVLSDSVTGSPIGSIAHPYQCCHPTLTLQDAAGQYTLWLRSPCFMCTWRSPCCCEKVNYKLEDANTGDPVAHIVHTYGHGGDPLSGANIFAYNVDVSSDAISSDANMMATIVAATVLVDQRFTCKDSATRNTECMGATGCIIA